jgi:ABC-2 type transport system permease protein
MLRVGFAEAVAYRAEFLVWLLSTNMPLVMLALWSAVARDAPVGRFGQAEFTDDRCKVAYFLAALVVRLLTGAWVIWELNQEIRQGTVAFRLLRPVHPLVAYACENVAAMPLRLALSLPVALVLLFTVGGSHVTRDPLLLALFPVSILGAWLITFLAMSIGASLLHRKAGSALRIWIAFGVFSHLVPLELYPRWVSELARYLPFRYMAFPVETVIGDARLQPGGCCDLRAMASSSPRRGVWWRSDSAATQPSGLCAGTSASSPCSSAPRPRSPCSTGWSS